MILRILFSTMIVQMKQSFARPMFRFCLIANPILNTILLYEMYKNSGENNFMAYVVLGAGLMGLWSCICFSSREVQRHPGPHLQCPGELSHHHPWQDHWQYCYVATNTIYFPNHSEGTIPNPPAAGKSHLLPDCPVCCYFHLHRHILCYSVPFDLIKENRAIHELHRDSNYSSVRFCLSGISSSRACSYEQLRPVTDLRGGTPSHDGMGHR